MTWNVFFTKINEFMTGYSVSFGCWLGCFWRKKLRDGWIGAGCPGLNRGVEKTKRKDKEALSM